MAAYIDQGRDLAPGRWWIECAKLFTVPSGDPIATWPDEVVFSEFGLIRAQVNRTGTVLTWDVDNVLDGSINTMLDRMESFPMPVTLAFFKTAWAVETLQTAHEARERISALLSLTDMPELQIVSVQPRALSQRSPLSPLIHGTTGVDLADADFQNLYRYDPATDDFIAEHIGRRSSIAALMGTEWARNAIGTNAAPNDDAANFDPPITARYRDVMETGDPAFDEVSAVTTPPNGPPMFVTWHRLLQPWDENGRRIGCRVTTSHVSQAFPSFLADARGRYDRQVAPFPPG